MSDSKDLKDLLDRLKGEVSSMPARQPEREPGPAPAPRQERFARPYRAPEPREPRAPSGVSQNQAWSENKESILFGMLASLIAALGGILAGIDYLVLTGAVLFSLFSIVMLLLLFRYGQGSGGRSGESQALADRIDALSRKVEMLSTRAVSGAGPSSSAGHGGDRELEQKVEELRVMVKSLSKAVRSE